MSDLTSAEQADLEEIVATARAASAPLPVRVVATDRKESEPCQASTPGCCIDHNVDHGDCQGW